MDRPAWLPYVLPMAVFLGLTYLEGPLEKYYVFFYIGKVVITTVALWLCRSTWSDIRFEPKLILPSVLLGAALCAIWIGVEKYVSYPHFLGQRTAFNPYHKIDNDGMRMAFIAVRMLGLALIVPIMEELFWRSFLLRYATKPEFKSMPIGTFSWTAFAFVAALFAAAHPEWIPALVFAAALGLLVKYTKSIFACVVTHAVTNLALGIYVLKTGAWQFW